MENRNLSKKEEYELRRAEKRQVNQTDGPRKRSNMALWVFGLLLIAAAVFAFTALSKDDSGNPDNGVVTGEVAAALKSDDHVKANPEARVILVEYSDFQCPACRTYYPLVSQLVKEIGGEFAFAYRHFPLISIHPNAKPAARAAEAAGLQGQFFAMHDRLFERQDEWANRRNPDELFLGYAETLGLDAAKFKSDYGSPAVEDRVERDFKEALKLGLNSTPTFFLNGKKIANPKSYEEFKALIEAAAAD